MNLKELSKLLGLSQTTVSRALNGYPEVNAQTRERVLRAVKETGYRPNKAAQRLATGKAGSIGLVMPTAPGHESDIHFGEFLSGIGDTARRHDHHLVMMPSDPDDEVGALRRLAVSGNVDALMIAYMRPNDPRLDMLRSLSLPYIVHGRSLHAVEDYPYVDIDNEAAFYDAARLLLQLGHRRIGLVTPGTELNLGYVFADAYRAALSANGLAYDPGLLVRSEQTSEEGGYHAADALLALDQRPTAMLLVNEIMAIGVYRRLHEAGLTPGRDMAVIGLRHSPQARFLSPALTCFDISLIDLGRRLAQGLLASMPAYRDSQPFGLVQEVWPMELVAGESDPPPR